MESRKSQTGTKAVNLINWKKLELASMDLLCPEGESLWLQHMRGQCI